MGQKSPQGPLYIVLSVVRLRILGIRGEFQLLGSAFINEIETSLYSFRDPLDLDQAFIQNRLLFEAGL